MPVLHRPAIIGPDSVRLASTIRVLGRWGLGGRLTDHAPAWVTNHLVAPDGELVRGRSQAERVRGALQELGPIYVKLGQLLSVSDALPADLVAELAELQEHAQAQPVEEIRAAVEAELGAPVDELFATFDPEPIGVASIAQVHRAALVDGTPVAVKVQHPGIDRVVHQDLDIIAALAGVIEAHVPEAAPYRPRDLAAQFRRRTLAELDFHREAANCRRFAQAFDDEPDVHFPRVVDERSAGRVLTLELLEGASLARSQDRVDGPAFAERIAELWLTMIFRDGFVHADPHPGNIFVLPGGRVGVIDCGMALRVDGATRNALGAIATAANAGDAEALAAVLLTVCDHAGPVDEEAFAEDLERGLTMVGGEGQVPMAELVAEMRSVVRSHGLVIPARLSLLAQVAAELEGTARSIDPGFHLTRAMHTALRRLAESHLRPQAVLARIEEVARHLTMSRSHPLRSLLERLSEGSFDLNVRHSDADEAVDRLTYGLLTAALLVGAPIVWHADPPPRRGGVSLVGAGMTGASMLMAADLVRRIRSTRRRAT